MIEACGKFRAVPTTHEGTTMFVCPNPKCGRAMSTREAFYELERCQR